MKPEENGSDDLEGLVKQLRITLKPRRSDVKNGGEVVSGPLPCNIPDAERERIRTALTTLISKAERFVSDSDACDRSVLTDTAMCRLEEDFITRMRSKAIGAQKVQEKIERTDKTCEENAEWIAANATIERHLEQMRFGLAELSRLQEETEPRKRHCLEARKKKQLAFDAAADDVRSLIMDQRRRQKTAAPPPQVTAPPAHVRKKKEKTASRQPYLPTYQQYHKPKRPPSAKREAGPPVFEVIVSEFPTERQGVTVPVTKFTIDPRETEEAGPLPAPQTQFIAEETVTPEGASHDFSFDSSPPTGKLSSMNVCNVTDTDAGFGSTIIATRLPRENA